MKKEQEQDLTGKTPDLDLDKLTAKKDDSGVLVTEKKPEAPAKKEDKPKKSRILIRKKAVREMMDTEDGPVMLSSEEKARMGNEELERLRKEGKIRPMSEEEKTHEKDVRALNWATNSAKKVTDEYERQHPESSGTYAPGAGKYITIANLGPATLRWNFTPENARKHVMNMTLSSGGKSQNIEVPFGANYRDFLDELKGWGDVSRAVSMEGDASDEGSEKKRGELLDAFKSGNFSGVKQMAGNTPSFMMDVNDNYYTNPEQFKRDWQERLETLAQQGLDINAVLKDIELPQDDNENSIAYAMNKLIGEHLLQKYADNPTLSKTIRDALEAGKWFGARNKDTGDMEYERIIDDQPFVIIKSNKREGLADERGEPLKKYTHKLRPFTDEEKQLRAEHNMREIQKAREEEVEKWGTKLTPEQERHNMINSKRNLNTLYQIMQKSGYEAAADELRKQLDENKRLKMFYNNFLREAKIANNLPSKELVRRAVPFDDFVKRFVTFNNDDDKHVWDRTAALDALKDFDFVRL